MKFWQGSPELTADRSQMACTKECISDVGSNCKHGMA